MPVTNTYLIEGWQAEGGKRLRWEFIHFVWKKANCLITDEGRKKNCSVLAKATEGKRVSVSLHGPGKKVGVWRKIEINVYVFFLLFLALSWSLLIFWRQISTLFCLRTFKDEKSPNILCFSVFNVDKTLSTKLQSFFSKSPHIKEE